MSTNPRSLRDFHDQYGISAICRRHFGYKKPVSDAEMGGYPTRGALTYMRALERGRMGLTHDKAAKAYIQGVRLTALGIVVAQVIVGDDQRNWDGGNATAEALSHDQSAVVPVFTSPAVTYPHYTTFGVVRAALEAHGDYAVHAYLAGAIKGIWSEPAEVFEARILAAVQASYEVSGPVLFDLNFEQITLLYFLLVQGLKRGEIPFAKGSWCPTMGGGVVISADRTQAMEFRPDLTLVE